MTRHPLLAAARSALFVLALVLPAALLVARGQWKTVRSLHAFDEQFGLRDTLVTWNGLLRLKALGVSSSDKVVVGRDGFLFYGAPDGFTNGRGLNPLQEPALSGWAESIKSRQRCLAARGIPLLVVIAPNKETVLAEETPAWATRVGPQTQLDQLLERLKGEPVELLDLRPTLLAAKAQARGPLYLQTDTHWTPYGAFFGARAVLGALQRRFPGVRVPREEGRTLAVSTTGGGDLARMLGLSDELTDLTAELLPIEPTTLLTLPSADEVPWKGDQLTTSDRGAIPQALILRDSFMTAMLQELAPAFGKAHLIWTGDLSLVESERPDVVIWELLERALNLPPPPRCPLTEPEETAARARRR